jgi:PKD repeat protein
MWGLSPSDNNAQINAFKATYGQTFQAAGTQGGGPAAKNVVISGQTFYGYPTYCVICPDRTIFFDICWPPSTSCFNNYIGQCVPPALIADFTADNLIPGIGETVNFTDLSTNSPYVWSWTFTPSSVTYVGGTSSASQNPKVQFDSDGYYTVELTATNAIGSDTETKTNYILVYGPTVADFTANNLTPGVGQTVNFTDMSTYDPIEWLWVFTPSTVTFVEETSATSQNPEVQFNEAGNYTVELTATNAFGTDTETKPNYITVSYYCGASGGFNFMYISNVQMETINNSSGQNYYADYTYLSTDLTQGQLNVQISVVNGNPYGVDDLGIWIDWNQNGTFSDVGENIVCEINDQGQGTFLFDVPADAVEGTTTMRVRIKYTGSDCGDACGASTYGEVEDYSINIIASDVSVDITFFLEGPFNGINMNSTLNSILPLSQPFDTTPWNYSGTENVTAIPGTDIVDWVLVDIRDALSVGQAIPATRIGRQAAFLRTDGRVVGLEGNPVLNFDTTFSNNLYIVVYQRNHIPIISGTSPIFSDGVYFYNFSIGEGQVFGGAEGHKEITNGIWGMRAGDGDGNGFIDIDDKTNIWESEAATKGYKSGDFNMDLDVNNKDKNNNWLPNRDKGTFVPD